LTFDVQISSLINEVKAGTKRLNIGYRCLDQVGVITFEKKDQEEDEVHADLELARRVVMMLEVA
jgi:hypothetical protein